MEYLTDNDIPIQIGRIEAALEGTWFLNEYGLKPITKYLTFTKPEVSGEWAKLTQSTEPERIEYIDLQYRVVMPNIKTANIELRANEESQIFTSRIDTLSSGMETLYITNHFEVQENYSRWKENQPPKQTQD